MRTFVALTSAVIWSYFASSAAAAPLQPITNWDVDYGDTQCTAARSFGDASAPTVLGLVPSLAGDTYKLIIGVPRPGPRYAEEVQGTVDFGHGDVTGWLLHYGGKNVKMSNFEIRISSAQMEQARSAATVQVRSRNGDSFNFALSDMPPLLDALSKCTTDLQHYWSGGHEVGPLSKTAKGDVRTIFSPDDYPSEAIARMQGGTTQFQLMVDEKGAVAGCDVVRQSGVPILDVMSCQVIKERAKFSHAMDAHGKAIRSVVTTPPIVWKITDEGVVPF